jgi:hypothetical protein
LMGWLLGSPTTPGPTDVRIATQMDWLLYQKPEDGLAGIPTTVPSAAPTAAPTAAAEGGLI